MNIPGRSAFLGILLVIPAIAWGDPPPEDLDVLQKGESNTGRTLILNPKGYDNLYRWAVGLSYTGGQVRFQPSSRWAMEARLQFGSADSDYGRVESNVFGLRGYHFYPFREHLALYAGGEAAFVKAESQSTSYSTKGFALGGFGGMEYRVARRVSVGFDIGPYMISLRESQTGMTQTSLDFIINTAVNFYLFK
jgi:hypothetical protein